LKKIKLDKDQRKAAVGTLIIHLLLLVALLFIALRTPLPLPGEEGVEVNLGYDDRGYGQIQEDSPPPEATPQPQPVEEVTPPEPEPEPEIAEEDIITQNIEEAPIIDEEIVEEKPEEPVEKPIEKPEIKPEPEKIVEKKPEEKPVDTIPVIEEPVEEVVIEKPKPVVNTRALYKGSSNSDTGSSQGITEGPGDQGKPHGDKESEKYDGRGGKGNGPSFFLGGRGSVNLETPSTQVTEQGSVVVSIWVDREGQVKKAQVNPKGTTVLDARLRQIAVDAALNSTFTTDQSAAELQRGTITYNFIIMK
jgi:outer membrane biosynthesis protein TonB